ncbi:hypothetical protein ACPEIC_09915 [Stenotrophomonas sp. NPDC087984]|nr:hypothetical protein [Streptomyces hygroscopicus]
MRQPRLFANPRHAYTCTLPRDITADQPPGAQQPTTIKALP